MEWGGRNERQWQEAYAAAKRYFAQHGNLNVPYDYVTPEGFRLGQWVVRQRMTYKGDFPTRIKSTARLSARNESVCWTLSGWTGGKKTPGKGTLRLCWPIIKSTAP